MGDATSGPVRLSFNPQLRVEFRGATVTSDAGLLLPRELDERLGLDALIERHLSDPRTGYNRQFPLRDLLRQSIYSRLAGYEDTNDAERLAEDPTFRMLASRERRETSVALTSTLHWFETEVLAEERNFQGLARLNTDLVQHEAIRPPTRRVTLDIDTNRAVVRFYNERGTAEQWIKKGTEATHWTRLSCHRFRANEVRLLLGVIAYTLGNLLRRLVLPLAIQSWSLTSLQQCLLKTGGRLMRHARYFTLQLAASYLTRPLFRQI